MDLDEHVYSPPTTAKERERENQSYAFIHKRTHTHVREYEAKQKGRKEEKEEKASEGVSHKCGSDALKKNREGKGKLSKGLSLSLSCHRLLTCEHLLTHL